MFLVKIDEFYVTNVPQKFSYMSYPCREFVTEDKKKAKVFTTLKSAQTVANSPEYKVVEYA